MHVHVARNIHTVSEDLKEYLVVLGLIQPTSARVVAQGLLANQGVATTECTSPVCQRSQFSLERLIVANRVNAFFASHGRRNALSCS